MWPFSKKEKRLSEIPEKLAFKSGADFFEYYCKFMQIPEIEVKRGCFGLVLDAKKEFDAPDPVKIETDGKQLAILKIVSSDGGFVVPSKTLTERGDRLKPGDLVIWMPEMFDDSQMKNTGKDIDSRFGWTGFIVAKAAPAIDLKYGKPNILCKY